MKKKQKTKKKTGKYFHLVLITCHGTLFKKDQILSCPSPDVVWPQSGAVALKDRSALWVVCGICFELRIPRWLPLPWTYERINTMYVACC